MSEANPVLLFSERTQRRKVLGFAIAVLLGLLVVAGGTGAAGGDRGGDGGYYSGNDGLPAEEDCRRCHQDLARFPSLLEINVEKHHFLIQTPVVLPTAPPGVVLEYAYTCFSCHPLVWDSAGPGYVISLYRDCLVCHPVATVSGAYRGGKGGNRHHDFGYQCDYCHSGRK